MKGIQRTAKGKKRRSPAFTVAAVTGYELRLTKTLLVLSTTLENGTEASLGDPPAEMSAALQQGVLTPGAAISVVWHTSDPARNIVQLVVTAPVKPSPKNPPATIRRKRPQRRSAGGGKT